MQHPSALAARALRPALTTLAGWLLLLLALAGPTQAQTTTYAYTGGVQTYTVPAGITAVQVVATGGIGGSRVGSYSMLQLNGAVVRATVAVVPGEVLTLMVGGQGGDGSPSVGDGAGGYNGGGSGRYSGGGGGATDVRRASGMGSTGDYLASRNALVVAGGSGGSGRSAAGGLGGGGGVPNGGNGQDSGRGTAGLGATQTAPGGGGVPGSGATGGAGVSSTIYSGGGGGGYYGGGAGSSSSGYCGGGGGSSWVMPTGSTGISYSLAPAPGPGSITITPVPTSFAYTGGVQTYTVPAGVRAVQLVATGASGGTYGSATNYSYGARAQATVLVTPGEVLTLVVGGQGGTGTGSTVPGGYNGGGTGNAEGGGGGASDVRRASATGNTGDYLTTRNALLVAGGGGGSDDFYAGGNGGTPSGAAGAGSSTGGGGSGATQSGPGSGGRFGSSYAGSPGLNGTGGAGSGAGGGGGGGYYGGGGGTFYSGGGGGSSWAMPINSTGISYSVASTTGNGAVTITPLPLPDLVVSTAGQTVAAGLYNSITVQSGGTATLATNTNVLTSTTVNSGGVLDDGCFVLSGSGSFTLAAGGTLGICAAAGLSSSGSTGSVQVTGTRSFSTDASYVYDGTSAQVTGPGLPATVHALTLSNSAGLTLTGPVTAASAATLSTGVLRTGATALTLGPAATLSEDADGYVLGTVQTTRALATAGTPESFGGLGLTLTPGGPALPGSTLVRRTTGTARTGAGTSQSVTRVFDIQPTVNTGLNVALALTIRDDERNGITPAGLRLFKSDNAGATWQPQRAATFATTAASGNQPTTYTASLAGVGNFSLWTLGDASNPLPVEMTDFTATPAGPAAVRLAWATASEKNSAAFEVERSTDGASYYKIGTVAAGSSSAPRTYKLLDGQLPAGAAPLYYRLRQIDLDGTFSYSLVRTVALTGAAAGLSLYPNPASGHAATLTGALPGAVVTVVDALGRPVLSALADATGTAALVLPVGLAPGVYVVRVGTRAVRLTVE